MGVTLRVFHTPEEYERGAIFAIRQSQNNIISYGHHIFLRLSVALVKLLKGSKFLVCFALLISAKIWDSVIS